MMISSYLILIIGALGALFRPVSAAFSITPSGSSLIVDTNAGLVFTVSSTSCDITSMLYNGKQAQDQSKYSHIASGLGTATVSYTTSGNYIKITCVTSTLTQYLVARNGDSSIHMATYTTAEPSVGELRFIARLNRAVLIHGPLVSDLVGTSVAAIEGSDVYLVDGQTRSKYYSSRQFIDDQVHGVTGCGTCGIGVYMVVPGVGYEGSSGGPFFRDIDNQGGTQQELYFYMNSGHTQTEAYRQGLHGPYILQFTTGAVPSSTPDISFWSSLGISGYVATSARGYVSGKGSGIPAAFASLVSIGWSNSVAQYWARADASTGNFYSPAMKPGTYTMTLYKVELAVATKSVTVTAGTTVTSNIVSTETTPTLIWQIGDFDGTPRGFLNADMIESMHPSDSRMHDWVRTYRFSLGIGYFPMAVFKALGPVTIEFSLTDAQLGARTLRIATTLAFAGARPQAVINSWSGPIPAAPSQPDSRGVTRGTWRGNNIDYFVSVPSGVLVSGYNTLLIYAVSGSSGDAYLSPNFVFDALSFY